MQKRQFSWPALRRRNKKMMRAKHKKTVHLTTLDKIWDDYVEHGIIRPLIKYGNVQIDDHTTLEITGKPDTKPETFGPLSKGLLVKRNGKMQPFKSLKGRSGYVYGIRVRDTNYKGNLIFKADPKLSKRVAEALVKTQNYYRIEK